MNKTPLLIMLLLTLSSAYASENLIINGDFSDRDDGWYGDNFFVKKIDGESCLYVKPDNKDELFIEQWLRLYQKPQSYSLKLKYKTSSDYKGEGIKIRVEAFSLYAEGRPEFSRASERSFTLHPTEEWMPLRWNINFHQDMSPCAQMKLQFYILPGDGKVYLDDIELMGSESPLDETLDPLTYAGNLLKNGDFSDRDAHWLAEKKKLWHVRDGILSIETNPDSKHKLRIRQPINSNGWKKFRIRCKYKTSKRYTSDGSYISLGYGKKSEIFVLPDTANMEWTELEWEANFSNVAYRPNWSKSLDIVILKGTGEIYFDDFELVGIP